MRKNIKKFPKIPGFLMFAEIGNLKIWARGTIIQYSMSQTHLDYPVETELYYTRTMLKHKVFSFPATLLLFGLYWWLVGWMGDINASWSSA